MPKKITLFLGCFLVLTLLVMGSFLPASPVQADNSLQGLPKLEGYKIYFTEDNGEASRFDRSFNGLSRLGGLLWGLGAELYTLEWRTGIPEDADLIIMAGPTSNITDDQTARMWSYLENDGHLLILADPVSGSGRNQQGISSTVGLFSLMWADMGIRLRDDTLVTENLDTDLPALIDSFMTTDVDPNHPTTIDITSELAFSTARSVEIDAAIQQYQTTPLVFSPSSFYGETEYPVYLEGGLIEYNIGVDTTRGPLGLAAATYNPATNTRIALIGDRDFATNGVGLLTSPPSSAAFLYPENPRFLARLIAWLVGADPTNVIDFTFQTPAPTGTPTMVPTEVVTNVDLVLTMTVSNPNPLEGEVIVYEITITNNGPDEAQNVFVTSNLPEGLTFASSTATSRRGYNADNGEWNVGSIEVETSHVLTIVAIVDEGTANQSIITDASITSSDSIDSNTSNDSARVEVTVAPPEPPEG